MKTKKFHIIQSIRQLGRMRIAAMASILISAMLLVGFMYSEDFWEQLDGGEFIRQLKERLNSYNEERPEERVYLHFDKPLYKPGETIWFTAYLRNGDDLKASSISDIIHVELISPKGTSVKQLKLIAHQGRAAGEFKLDESMSGGIYKVKAYTNWQKNDGEVHLFERELQVQQFVLPNLKMTLDFEREAFGAGDKVIAKVKLQSNENQPLENYDFRYVAEVDGQQIVSKTAKTDDKGVRYIQFDLPKILNSNDGLLNVMIDYEGQSESISRSVPIVLNNLKFALYPEGGDLVEGLKTKVAFRALNEFDKPADVEGIVIDDRGQTVSSFKSYHQGMGAFELIPQAGRSYTAHITKPLKITQTFDLPEALPRGYILNLDHEQELLMATINTTENEELVMVGQIRGKMYYSQAIQVSRGTNRVKIPVESCPPGVMQVTLFDSKGIARAERLAFVNKDKQLKIDIKTDKAKYQPREKVKMTITVHDERGMPMPAILSLSVANDQLLSFADDKTGNILSQLLLEQDIKEKVHEAKFYFDPKEEKADQALDYLLMTAGWRRFSWEKLMNEKLPMVQHQPERAIYAGKVIDNYTGELVSKAKIMYQGKTVQCDDKGRFRITDLDLHQPQIVQVSAKDFDQQQYTISEYGENQTLTLYSEYIIDIEEEMIMEDAAMAMPVRAFAGGNVRKAAPRNRANEGMGAMKRDKGLVNKPQAQVPEAPALKQEQKKDELQDIVEVVNLEEVVVADDRMEIEREAEKMADKEALVATNYHRAREFAAPLYEEPEEQQVSYRTDFRQTLYWNGMIEVNRTGKTTVEFYNSDEVTSFRAVAEGIGADGLVGRSEMTYFTQLPVAMKIKLPVELATQDLVSIPLTLKNNTRRNLHGSLKVEAPESLKALNKIAEIQSLKAGEVKVIYCRYRVRDKVGTEHFKAVFNSSGFSDAFVQPVKVVAKGFPVTASFSGQEKVSNYIVNIANVVDGSISAKLTAYPSVVSDLLTGVEAILREPYGCFEQTSMSSYPNVMVMQYLQNTEQDAPAIRGRAEGLLERGYKRLVSFETSTKGYEWFGGSPGHEALTAYGLLQFNDMKTVYDVDQGMIDRTANWLFSRRDGKGGFKKNPRALDSFGRADDDITNAYIVYSLAEAGYKDIEKELNTAYDKALKNKDTYQYALIANAMYSFGDDKRGDKMLALLLKEQAKDGAWTGSRHSITRSTGHSLSIETTSLAVMAILKSENKDVNAINKAVKFLVEARSGYGMFGSTQGTVLALKALTQYAQFSKRTDEDGTIQFFVDGKKVAEQDYKAGENEPIVLENLEQYIGEGKHKLTVKYLGVKNPLPFSLAVSWNTVLPNSSEECLIGLESSLNGHKAKVGETLRLTTTVTNRSAEGQGSTIAIIGIPAGLTAQPWQLKELQEKGRLSYYEQKGNNIICYFRQMAPNEVKTINLDLKAEVPGQFEAPASSAYLYYTNEHKSWVATDPVEISQ